MPRSNICKIIALYQPPEDLQRYKDIDPRLVDMFMTAWEGERKHRYAIAEESLKTVQLDTKQSHRRQLWGMALAFLSLLCFIALTGYALYLNNLWFAGIMGFFCIGTIVTSFLKVGRNDTE